jgi:hypothetical protein
VADSVEWVKVAATLGIAVATTAQVINT